MKTKTIFKTLALAMMMPAMMLTTACSNDDDVVNNTANTENTINKGYALPVTVNVTREGDATTRATYTESTGKLAFSAGDKLFVGGNYDDWSKSFAGTLDYDAESGKFKGTIYTEDDTYKTYEDLFGNSDDVTATLLPAGYESYGYLVINTNDPDAQYDDYIDDEESNEYTLATSKADGVAQFSYEEASSYNDGFALSPNNAILNFTVTGLAANTDVAVSLTSIAYKITGTVKTDASGTATFAAGITDGLNLQPFSLTVGGKNITLVSSDKEVAKGKIYNITRGTGATVDLSTKNTDYTAQNGETLTGTLASNVKISIANGATVILDNVTINGTNDIDYVWGGINCEGNAKIILKGTNTLKGFYYDYPGIYVPDGYTLTIEGTGSLNASSNGKGAGIGGGYGVNCGKIIINGGTITATGGDYAAGIGGGGEALCWGDITINGGTITATGGDDGAGIGSGGYGSCSEEWFNENSGEMYSGDITINGGTITADGGFEAAGIGSGYYGSCSGVIIKNTVTRVTATKGSDDSCAIGYGSNGSCAIVTIDGTVGYIAESPFTYEP